MVFFSFAGQLVGQVYSLLPVIMGRKGVLFCWAEQAQLLGNLLGRNTEFEIQKGSGYQIRRYM